MNDARPKIVLVDDNAATLSQGKNLLQSMYKVYTVGSAVTMFENLESDIPDLILLDVEMPDMDGFDAIAKLKSDTRYKDIPVIFVTSRSDEESERKGFALGAVDYIAKPFSAPLLQKRISNQILYMRVQKAINDYTSNIEVLAEEVSKANERTRLLLDKMPYPCRLWDNEHRIIDCNEAVVKLFGFKNKKDCLERHFLEFPEFQPDGRNSIEKVKEYINKAFAKGYCVLDWEYRALDGTVIPAELTLVRVEYYDSYAVAGYARDLREHLKMEEERQRADKAEKSKTDFVTQVRVPVNTIIDKASLALREKTPEEKDGIIDAIRQEGQNLLKILENFR